jgi:hypothetical protein
VTGTLPTANGGTNLTSFTSGGVIYASSSSALATGSALQFDGGALSINNTVSRTLNVNSTGASGVGIALQNSSSIFGYIGSAKWVFGGTLDDVGISTANATNLVLGTNGTTGLTLTSSSLYTASGINVGIGTSSPANPLNIVKDNITNRGQLSLQTVSATNFSQITFYDQTTLSAQIYQGYSTDKAINIVNPLAHGIAFWTNSTERMRLDSLGNLGLGVTPSAWFSTIKAFQVGNGGFWSLASGNNTTVGSNVYVEASAASSIYITNGYATRYQQLDGSHRWYNSASGTAGNAITFTQAMTLSDIGRLGIGTTSPTTVLDVYHATNSDQYWRTSAISLYAQANNTNGTAVFGTLSIHPLVFFANNAERVRIDTSGNLLVGTTSSDPITANVNGTQIAAQNSRFSSNDVALSISRRSTDGTAVTFLRGTSAVGSIGVTTVLTTYNTTSDYRLKTVVGAVTGHGARLDSLEPIEYTWNVNGLRTRGFLAHKFQEVYAGSVTGAKDAVDEEGNPVYQAMQASSSEVIADLVAEIQSLRQRLSAANL